ANVKHVPADTPRSPINSIAVLPFRNVGGDPDLDYLVDGIAEVIINNLSQLSQLKVMSRNSTFRYKGREAEASTIGRELNTQAVLTGRIAKHNELLSISVELVDTRDDSNIWGAQYIRQPSDLFTMQERIAQEITQKLRLKLTGKDQTRLARRHTEDPE